MTNDNFILLLKAACILLSFFACISAFVIFKLSRKIEGLKNAITDLSQHNYELIEDNKEYRAAWWELHKICINHNLINEKL